MKVEGGTWLMIHQEGGSANDAFCAACFAPFVGISEVVGYSQRVRGHYTTEASKAAGGSQFVGASCSKIDNRRKMLAAKMAF